MHVHAHCRCCHHPDMYILFIYFLTPFTHTSYAPVVGELASTVSEMLEEIRTPILMTIMMCVE